MKKVGLSSYRTFKTQWVKKSTEKYHICCIGPKNGTRYPYFSRYSCKEHTAFKFFKYWAAGQQAASLHFKLTLCAKLLPFQKLQRGYLWNEKHFALQSLWLWWVMAAPSSEPSFTRRMEWMSRHDGFVLHDKLGFDCFSTSEMQYPSLKVKLELIRARTKFYLITDNQNIILRIFEYLPYTPRVALTDYYHKKRADILAKTFVEYNYLEPVAKTFILPARQHQFIQKKLSKNTAVCRIAYALDRTVLSLECTLNIRSDISNLIRGAQPIVDFHAAHSCCDMLRLCKLTLFKMITPQFELIFSEIIMYWCLVWLQNSKLLKKGSIQDFQHGTCWRRWEWTCVLSFLHNTLTNSLYRLYWSISTFIHSLQVFLQLFPIRFLPF